MRLLSVVMPIIFIFNSEIKSFMSREIIIEKTVQALNKLPLEKAEEVADFADYILKKYEEQILQKGIYKLVEDSAAFHFLHEEEELYRIS